ERYGEDEKGDQDLDERGSTLVLPRSSRRRRARLDSSAHRASPSTGSGCRERTSPLLSFGSELHVELGVQPNRGSTRRRAGNPLPVVVRSASLAPYPPRGQARAWGPTTPDSWRRGSRIRRIAPRSGLPMNPIAPPARSNSAAAARSALRAV